MTFKVGNRVSPNSKVTYLQLLSPVFAGAKPDQYIGGLEADGMGDIRQLDTGEVKKGYSGPLGLTAEDGFVYGGGTRRLILFRLSSGQDKTDAAGVAGPDGRRSLPYPTMLLAVFRIKGEPAMLDLAEVTTKDVLTYLRTSNLGGYFWLVDEHDNCDWHLKSYALISRRGDKLSVVFDELPEIYDYDDCGRSVQQEPYLSVGPHGHAAGSTMYLNIVSTVTGQYGGCPAEFGPRESKFFQFRLRITAGGRFIAIVSPKKDLHRENVRLGLESDEPEAAN